jgi:hypothetical protein
MVLERSPGIAGADSIDRVEKDPVIQPLLFAYVAISAFATAAYLAWGFARAKAASA